jgi:Tetratricopeptide repeat
MLTDRYDLALSTASAAARDAYVRASDLALTFYPGAAEAYDRAIAADPGFALAHAGKAQLLMRQGDVAAARVALGPPRTWPPVCLSARQVISGSSTLFSRAGRTRQSRPCTHI